MNNHLLAGILLATFTRLSVSSAPIPWNGHYYEFVYSPSIIWSDAQALAQNSQHQGMQGHLVTVTSDSENTFVATLIDGVTSYPGDPSNDSVLETWIGGFQEPPDELDPGKGWNWVNGEGAIPVPSGSSPYANWFTGEPNDWLGPASEVYLAMWGNDGYGNTIGSFNDEGGLWNISGYLVEYESSTIPDSGASGAYLAFAAIGAVCLRSRAGTSS